ncbi:hypothetical protein Syn7502_00364 [Synechococcus sp. PCC 7502]|nr:hypothetical protein Syn7502_00364 [Synechococcus sp. PCC 7502]
MIKFYNYDWFAVIQLYANPFIQIYTNFIQMLQSNRSKRYIYKYKNLLIVVNNQESQ